MADKEEKPNCWRNHWLLFAGFIVSFAVMFIVSAVSVRDSQAAMAEKLEVRIRAQEIFSAAVAVKLEVIARDIKDIKRAVSAGPITHKPQEN